MSDLEKDLALALRREEPPEGFAERVLARVAAEGPPAAVPASRRRGPLYVLALAAAAALAGMFAFGAWRVASPPAETGPDRTKIAVAPPVGTPETLPVVSPPPDVTKAPVSRKLALAQTRRPVARRRAASKPEGPSLAEARHAKEQLLLALRIASDHLGATRRMILDEEREPGS
jgi:hypothetical protein